MIELQCRWLWVSRRRERKKGGKSAGRESKRSRNKTAERHQLLWQNETFTSHWTVGHLWGILVVSTTLVLMSHARSVCFSMGVKLLFCSFIRSTEVWILRCYCVYDPRGSVNWKECFQTISAQHFSTYSAHSPPFPQAFNAEPYRKNIWNTVYLIAVNCWLDSLAWSEWNIAERDSTYWWRHDGMGYLFSTSTTCSHIPAAIRDKLF